MAVLLKPPGIFVGRGFTGCGKIRFLCHSERSEESLLDLSPMHGEILRFAQNDELTFSAASSAATLRLRLSRPLGPEVR